MSLRELQERFQSHLLGADPALLADIAERGTLGGTPSGTLGGTPGGTLRAAERLAIYRHAYGARLTDALRANFPKLHLALGDEAFAGAAAGYIAAHPSLTRSIRWYGQRLPEHLARTPPWSAQPILAELARFEWALTEVFDAADATAIGREALAGVEHTEWGALRFVFHPALRTVSLAWNAVAVWKALDVAPQAAAPSPTSSGGEQTWLLWREQYQNRFRCISAAEATALAWAMDGASFAQVCEALTRVMPEAEVPRAAAGFLAAWLDGGLLVEIHREA